MWMMSERNPIRLRFRNLEVVFDHYEHQTPGSNLMELVSLVACNYQAGSMLQTQTTSHKNLILCKDEQ